MISEMQRQSNDLQNALQELAQDKQGVTRTLDTYRDLLSRALTVLTSLQENVKRYHPCVY
jgi:hypothetical protein